MAKNARFDLNTVEGLADAVTEMLSEMQRKHTPLKVVPNLQEISEGEIVVYDDGVNKRIYTKLNGVLHKSDLTAV